MYCLLFFFQAEDGIRDLVRSRGLGDVYKRQVRNKWVLVTHNRIDFENLAKQYFEAGQDHSGMIPVSYTHLTLPTSDLV